MITDDQLYERRKLLNGSPKYLILDAKLYKIMYGPEWRTLLVPTGTLVWCYFSDPASETNFKLFATTVLALCYFLNDMITL